MKIESKADGWTVSGINIKLFPHNCGSFVTLNDIDKLSQRSAQWILDHYKLVNLNAEDVGCHFGVIMKYSDMLKISIMESYPEIEKELADYFNPSYGDWTECSLWFAVWAF